MLSVVLWWEIHSMLKGLGFGTGRRLGGMRILRQVTDLEFPSRPFAPGDRHRRILPGLTRVKAISSCWNLRTISHRQRKRRAWQASRMQAQGRIVA